MSAPLVRSPSKRRRIDAHQNRFTPSGMSISTIVHINQFYYIDYDNSSQPTTSTSPAGSNEPAGYPQTPQPAYTINYNLPMQPTQPSQASQPAELSKPPPPPPLDSSSAPPKPDAPLNRKKKLFNPAKLPAGNPTNPTDSTNIPTNPTNIPTNIPAKALAKIPAKSKAPAKQTAKISAKAPAKPSAITGNPAYSSTLYYLGSCTNSNNTRQGSKYTSRVESWRSHK